MIGRMMRRYPVLFAALCLFFALVFPDRPVKAASSCPSGHSPKDLAASILEIRQFFTLSRGTPSFNYDRLDFLLANLETTAGRWSRCRSTGPGPSGTPGPAGSAHYDLLVSRIHALRAQIKRDRSLTPEMAEPAPSRRTLQAVENILSRFPAAKPAIPSAKSPSPEPARKKSGLSRLFLSSKTRWAILGTVVVGGVLFLLRVVRKEREADRADRPMPALGEREVHSLREIGSLWAAARAPRRQLLERIKDKIAAKGRFVRIRAQLLAPGAEQKWTVADELSDDEGGGTRTFEETPDTLEAREVVEEVPLGKGESRIRVVLPLPEEEGKTLLLVVDALASDEIAAIAPDPSGLRSYAQMKEHLYDLAHKREGEEKIQIGVISFLFDDPDRRRIHERTDGEGAGTRSFVVREILRLTGPGTIVYGEPPGTFHLVLYGRSKTETGVWIRKISEGLGENATEGTGDSENRPWFRRVLVAYTLWRDPGSKKIGPFLGQIQENIAKLERNPRIRTVIDA